MRALTLAQITALLTGRSISSNMLITGFSVDSRSVLPGNVFFALPGAKTDGHAHIAEVAARGAMAAVVNNAYVNEGISIPLIRVSDPLQALQKLAKNLLQAQQAKIVAITGSVGKTTTKNFTSTLLRKKYRVGSSPGNYNSQIGLPLAILNHIEGDEEILVLEMGMTCRGNISNLVRIAPPDIAVICSIAFAHANNFQSLEEIARAKGEIFSHPKTSLGIINQSIDHFHDLCLIGSCRKHSFSTTSRPSDFFLVDSNDQLQISCFGEKNIPLGHFKLPGKHNRQNLLAAIAVARNLEMSWEEIRQTIPSLILPERRLQIVEKNGIIFINDSYNASAMSTKAALESLPEPKNGGKKIAVIGEMLDLGKFSEQCHQEVGEVALQHVNTMFCLGKECLPTVKCWREANRPVEHFSHLSDLTAALQQNIQAGDVVLLKGSNANRLWEIIENLPELSLDDQLVGIQ